MPIIRLVVRFLKFKRAYLFYTELEVLLQKKEFFLIQLKAW